MREERWRGLGLFLAALLITWMIAAGVWASMAALYRMEQTMSPGVFVLFSLEPRGDELVLTLSGQPYILPKLPEIPEKFLSFRGRGLLLAGKGILEGFEYLAEDLFRWDLWSCLR